MQTKYSWAAEADTGILFQLEHCHLICSKKGQVPQGSPAAYKLWSMSKHHSMLPVHRLTAMAVTPSLHTLPHNQNCVELDTPRGSVPALDVVLKAICLLMMLSSERDHLHVHHNHAELVKKPRECK